jgi:ribosomal protein S18 acetylase RimI-like enzyme
MTDTANTAAQFRIEEWQPHILQNTPQADAELDMLAGVLHAVVHAGASVSFFTPFSIDQARAFWAEKVLPQVHARTRRVLVARRNDLDDQKDGDEERGGRIVGTVQLELEMPPNQQHRAAVAKLLVHPVERRQGIARALMIALEEIAQFEKRTLLTLDTVSGSNAEFLYTSLGYITAGVIPRYARGALSSDLEGTTIMYKELKPADEQATETN